MSQTPDELELIALTLIQSRLDRGEFIYTFTAGNLRGKLVSAKYLVCLPSPTYLPSNGALADKLEPCIQLVYIPRPRGRDTIKDPTKFNFTRKAVLFNIPTRLINSALFLQRLADNVWMLNIVTSVKV